jgi:hypothetical protein
VAFERLHDPVRGADRKVGALGQLGRAEGHVSLDERGEHVEYPVDRLSLPLGRADGGHQ